MLGAWQNDHSKDQRILQTQRGVGRRGGPVRVEPAHQAEHAPEVPDPRIYGVQCGTIWDTIAYTMTGSFGDWVDSPSASTPTHRQRDEPVAHLQLRHRQMLPDGRRAAPRRRQQEPHLRMVNYTLLPGDQLPRPGQDAYISACRAASPTRGEPTRPARAGLPTQRRPEQARGRRTASLRVPDQGLDQASTTGASRARSPASTSAHRPASPPRPDT